METKQILQVLAKLAFSERLIIAEALLRLNYQEQTSLTLDQQTVSNPYNAQ